MYTAIEAAKLLLLVGLSVLYLLGLGWLAFRILLHGKLSSPESDFSLLRQVPLWLMSGILINYGLVLAFQSLAISIVIGGIISIIGISGFVVPVLRYHEWHIAVHLGVSKWIGVAFVCLLFLGPILAMPIGVRVWDAYAIWFFHAKMIYMAGSIGPAAGWQHSSVVFSHTDYPNLIPALAAEVAYVVGFWNEYIPKLSLFFMLIPALGWLLTFARRSFSFLILLLLIPFSLDHWLWDGHMDGYLALYFSIAILLLGRYVQGSRQIDLLSSICCLSVLPHLKNEGFLAAFIGLGLVVFVLYCKKKLSRRALSIMNWQYYLAGVLALLPLALWSLYKYQMHLVNDLEIGSMQSVLRSAERWSGGSYKLILQSSYRQVEGALLLLGLLYFVAVIWNVSLPKASVFALLTAGVYFACITFIYLSTPHDLVWHLDTSIDRTMLSVNGCLFIGCYYVLKRIEEDEMSDKTKHKIRR